jgi:hypothetical protein
MRTGLRTQAERGACSCPQGTDHRAGLVQKFLANRDCAPVGLAARTLHLQHGGPQTQMVVGARRQDPGQVVDTRKDQARSRGELSGCTSSASRRPLSSSRSRSRHRKWSHEPPPDPYERLRVVAAGEIDDLVLSDQIFPELEHLTWLVIIEPAFLRGHRHRPPCLSPVRAAARGAWNDGNR